MNPMILGRGFALGVVVPVITLVTGILSKIPVFTITSKRKAVSGMVTVVPVCLAIVVILLIIVGLGCDPYEADIWWGILAMYGVCWLAFSALSCLVQDAKCILKGRNSIS